MGKNKKGTQRFNLFKMKMLKSKPFLMIHVASKPEPPVNISSAYVLAFPRNSAE